MRKRTKDWNAIRSWWHRLPNHQQKDDQRQKDRRFEVDQRQKDRRFEVDLLTRLDWQEEAEKRDKKDEKTRRDEVDNVEETATAHVDAESDVRVRLLAAGVELLMPFCGDVVDDPLLVLGRVVDARRKRRLVVEDVEFEASVRPRDEGDVTVLGVEREVLDVQCAVRFDERRVQPEHHAVIRHDRVCHHEVVELLAGATSIISIISTRSTTVQLVHVHRAHQSYSPQKKQN